MEIVRRTPNYRYKSDFKQGQVFSPLEVQYHFNASKNILEELPDKVDTDKKIQSFKNVALDNVLERFMPNVDYSDTLLDRYTDALDDLDVLVEASEFAESLREKYNLDPNLDYMEVLDTIQKFSSSISEEIKKLVKPDIEKGISEPEVKEVKKEVESNEKKETEPKSVSA